jgi:hypothetical protein
MNYSNPASFSGDLTLIELRKLARDALSSSAALEFLRYVLLNCFDLHTLNALITTKDVRQSGVIAAVLSNPHFPQNSRRVITLMNVRKEDIPTHIRKDIRASIFYQMCVVSTRDIHYIEASGIGMDFAAHFGLIREDYDLTTILFGSKVPEQCVVNRDCSDDLVLRIYIEYFTQQRKRKNGSLKLLARHRPQLLLPLQEHHQFPNFTAVELCAISDFQYFDLTWVNEKNAAHLLHETSLPEVVEYILANFDMVHLLLQFSHDEHQYTESHKVGYYRYLHKHKPETVLRISGIEDEQEMLEMLKFEHVTVEWIHDDILMMSGFEFIERLRELGYDFSNNAQYLESLTIVDV